MRTFLDTVGAKARIDGIAQSTYLRVARRKKRVYLDLGGPNWVAVRIIARGWKIMRRTQPPFESFQVPTTDQVVD